MTIVAICYNITDMKKLTKRIRSFIETGLIKVLDTLSYVRFKNNKIRNNSVLIIEPNAYHGEILSGYSKYFQDLGYNVDLLLRHENVSDSSLIYIKNINIYDCSSKCTKKILELKKICEYEYIFISSSALWDANKEKTSFLNYINFIPQTKHGLLIVEHNLEPYLAEYNEQQYLEENRLFTLSGFDNTPMLNPHYFKEIKPNHKKNNKTVFIVSGHTIKAEELLINSVTELVKNNITNFEIRITGAKMEIPKQLKKYIKNLGYLKFKNLYKVLEDADFILPMLDEFDKKHQRYLKGTTSGARQLSLGFLKPMLINEKFAKVYDFDNTNSVIYVANSLSNAMKIAIGTKQEDYATMQKSLEILANNIYNKSLENLKTAVGM